MTHKTLLPAFVLFSSFTLFSPAPAAVLITFQQDGPHVTATLSGSIDFFFLNSTPSKDLTSPTHSSGGDNTQLWVDDTTPFDVYMSGVFTESPLTVAPDTPDGAGFSGLTNFGYEGQLLFVPADWSQFDTHTVEGTWRWSNNTLAGIGLGSLTATPEVVYSIVSANGDVKDTISINTVPEPSSTLLLGLGAFSLVARRHRGKS